MRVSEGWWLQNDNCQLCLGLAPSNPQQNRTQKAHQPIPPTHSVCWLQHGCKPKGRNLPPKRGRRRQPHCPWVSPSPLCQWVTGRQAVGPQRVLCSRLPGSDMVPSSRLPCVAPCYHWQASGEAGGLLWGRAEKQWELAVLLVFSYFPLGQKQKVCLLSHHFLEFFSSVWFLFFNIPLIQFNDSFKAEVESISKLH